MALNSSSSTILKERSVLFFIITGVVINVLIIAFLLVPSVVRTKELQAKIAQGKQRNKLTPLYLKLKEAQSKVNLPEWEKNAPGEKQTIAAIIRKIKGEAADAELQCNIGIAKPISNEEQRKYYILPLHLTGNFEQMREFARTLIQMDTINRITDLKINSLVKGVALDAEVLLNSSLIKDNR